MAQTGVPCARAMEKKVSLLSDSAIDYSSEKKNLGNALDSFYTVNTDLKCPSPVTCRIKAENCEDDVDQSISLDTDTNVISYTSSPRAQTKKFCSVCTNGVQSIKSVSSIVQAD